MLKQLAFRFPPVTVRVSLLIRGAWRKKSAAALRRIARQKRSDALLRRVWRTVPDEHIKFLRRLNDPRENAASLLQRVWRNVRIKRQRFQSSIVSGQLTLGRTARWIRSAVEELVASQVLGLSDLLECNGAVYVHVHSVAMVSLVVDSAPSITETTCPETLLLGVGCLEKMRQEFRELVAIMTMGVTAIHFFVKQKGDALADRPVLLQIKAHLAEARPVGNLRPTMDAIRAILRQSSLSDKDQDWFARAMYTSILPTDGAHALM